MTNDTYIPVLAEGALFAYATGYMRGTVFNGSTNEDVWATLSEKGKVLSIRTGSKEGPVVGTFTKYAIPAGSTASNHPVMAGSLHEVECRIWASVRKKGAKAGDAYLQVKPASEAGGLLIAL